MNNLSETKRMILSSVREFAIKYIKPYVSEWDENQHFPIDVMRKLGKYGFLGVLIPEKYGGSGLGYLEYSLIIQEITKIDPSIGLSIAAHNSLCTNHIYKFGNEAQRQRWITKLATGEAIGAWGLTEPNTGSDAANMSCVAKRKGDMWVLNGTKNFITHGKSRDIAVVVVRTGEPRSKNNATAFVIENKSKGFSAGKKENKLGMRASETAEMIFEDCEIPDTNRLGEVGQGFNQSMQVLDGGRISIASLALGIAKGAYDAALKYSKERMQFNVPISKFQGVSFKLVDMITEIEASELLINKAIEDLAEKRVELSRSSAIAKLFASEACVRIANEALQIHGGYGYLKDFPVEKFYRDAKLCTIGEGTSEIQKVIIAKSILKE